jgi:hypothetical protein
MQTQAKPGKNQQTVPQPVVVHPITLSSPRDNDTLGPNFTACGTYSVPAGVAVTITVTLVPVGGGPSGPGVNAQLNPARGTWSVNFHDMGDGVFDLEATLNGLGTGPVTAKAQNLTIEGTPTVAVVTPEPGWAVGTDALIIGVYDPTRVSTVNCELRDEMGGLVQHLPVTRLMAEPIWYAWAAGIPPARHYMLVATAINDATVTVGVASVGELDVP